MIRESLEELSLLAADLVRGAAAEAVRRRGAFLVGLSGGSTPARTYDLLAEQGAGRPALPWAATQVYWCDERCVPPDDPESNYGLVRRHLLSLVPLPPENVHRIRGEGDPFAAAAEYDRLLPPQFDLLLLGIGEDGHTASLFPGSPALHDHLHRAAAVVASKPPPQRITITPPVIEAARQLLVLAAGAGKAAAVARALGGPEDLDACPAQLARRGVWLLDREAAAGLGRQ